MVSFVRRDGEGGELLVVLNLTPVPHHSYRVGSTRAGSWKRILNTDDPWFGGSAFASQPDVVAEAIPHHGQPQSIVLSLPPLAAVVYEPLG